MTRYALPDCDEMGLLLRAVVEPGVAAAVVDVCAGLAAGSGVHVDDDVEAFFVGPLDYAVEKGEAFGVIGFKELIVDGNADGVEAGLAEKMDVFSGDVVFAVLMPEICCFVWTEEFGYEAFDLAS